MDESPLFARAYDLLKETLVESEHMPCSGRAGLGRRMEDAAFAFHDALIDATKTREPRPLLWRADAVLARYRVCLRLGVDLKLFSEGRMEVLMRLVAECGRLLGGWQKELAPPPRAERLTRAQNLLAAAEALVQPGCASPEGPERAAAVGTINRASNRNRNAPSNRNTNIGLRGGQSSRRRGTSASAVRLAAGGGPTGSSREVGRVCQARSLRACRVRTARKQGMASLVLGAFFSVHAAESMAFRSAGESTMLRKSALGNR